MKKTTFCIVSALLVLIVLVSVGMVVYFFTRPLQEQPPDNKGITVLDGRGNLLLTAKDHVEIYTSEYWAYLELALAEATDIVAQQEKCDSNTAAELLFSQGYQLQTVFDANAFEALQAVKSRWGNTLQSACAITDLNGNLLAVCSTDTEEKQINYTRQRRSPYSSFKALSVYTPAVEKGIANWATMYQDAPYKQIKDASGKMQDWPANVTETYSMKNVPVYEALRTSLNTVAVNCLAAVGVSESMEFLQNSFGIPLKEETYVVQTYGADEVIGNIALGYMETGITPVEMAGYYQIFANGGSYIPPRTVQSITREDGTAIYTRQSEPKQIVSAQTADTMNKLLQGVVAPGGTGEAARLQDVEIAGKTGTGDNYGDNWFVGVTPGYSLAVWHGKHDSNQAEEMFAAVIQRLYSTLPNANRKFVTHQNLYQIVYCTHSGKAFSPACTRIDVGYFPSKNALPICDMCSTSKKER